MGPVRNISNEDCVNQFQTTELFNITSSNINANNTAEIAESELQALLYIVVTLLFYSLGIIIGIVTYLKREKQEMEEDRVFDEFLSMQHDPFAHSRFKRVQVIKTVEFLQARDLTNSECKNKIIDDNTKEHAQIDSKYEMASNPKPLTFMCDKEDKTYSEDEDFDEPLSALVAKLIDPEKHRTLEHDLNVESSDHGNSSGNNSNTGSPKREKGMHESTSMQSLKDYAEEPRRNERSSLSSEDDVTTEQFNVDESAKLVDAAKNKSGGNQTIKTNSGDNDDVKTGNSGSCIVTNV